MNNTLNELLYGIGQELKPALLKAIISLKNGDEYVQISTYDGITNSLRDDEKGITFNLSDKLNKIINENSFFSREIKVEDYREQFWWALSELRQKEVNLFIKPLYKPLINDLEEMGIIIFITLHNLTVEINNILDREYMLINESAYDLYKNYEKNNIIRVFINSMVKMLKQDHPNIYEHSLRTSDLATLISQAFHLSTNDVENLRNAAIIHDFGKIFLSKSHQEFNQDIKSIENQIYYSHTDKLFELFQNNPYMKNVLNIAYKHHEKPNKKGYYGLGEEDLGILDHILIISNIFDNLFYQENELKTVKQVLEKMDLMADRREIDKNVFENSKEIISSFYGGFLHFSPVISIGISKNIHIQDPVKKEEMHKAEIINSLGNLIIINFEKDPNFSLGRNLVFICDVGGLIEKFTAKIISKTKNNYTLLITVKEKNKEKTLKIYWNEAASLYKLPGEFRSLEEIKLEKYFEQKILVRKLGGKELVFESDEEISIGEKRIVSFEYKGEKILIPGIINGKIHENNKIIHFFEYLEMEDKCLSKVYRAIFKKQVELKLKV